MEVLCEDLVDSLKEAEVLFKGVLQLPTDLVVTPMAKLDTLPPTVHAINLSMVVADLVVEDVEVEVVMEDMQGIWWPCMLMRQLPKRVLKLDLRKKFLTKKTECAQWCLLYTGGCSMERKFEYSLT